MHIEINYRDGPSSPALDERTRETLMSALGHLAERLTRVEVHLGDENSRKAGPADKRCMLEARPKGLDPIAVEVFGADYYGVVHEAAGKLRRALQHRFERLAE
jgi:hypothetical protein